MKLAALRHLRPVWLHCAAAALLPLPALLALDPASNSEISLLYLALASAWLSTEIFQQPALPRKISEFRVRIAAITLAIAANTAFFTLLGVAIGVRSNIPFPLLSALSVLPAIGLIPWLRLRINHPIAVIIMAAVIVLATKLLGCIAARLVYGPDYIAKGYVSDDWHAAKLMITTLWFLTTTLSIGALLHTLYHAPSPPAA